MLEWWNGIHSGLKSHRGNSCGFDSRLKYVRVTMPEGTRLGKRLPNSRKWYARVAQRLAHLLDTQGVTGSNPVMGTLTNRAVSKISYLIRRGRKLEPTPLMEDELIGFVER